MAINSKPLVHQYVVCANLFVKKENSYLMLRRSSLKEHAPNYIHPIGGKVDQDENPYIAAQRELLEEAGIEVTNMRLEACVLEVAGDKSVPNWLIFHFSGDYKSGDLIKTDEGELLWFHKKDILKQNLFPSVKKIIHHILNPSDGPVFATFHYDENLNIIETGNTIDLCVGNNINTIG